MYLHANAKLGLAARFALVQAIEGGCSIRAAARRFNVSPATAHRWWHRWSDAAEEARRTLGCLFDRSSRPHNSPAELAQELQERICACRRETGWGTEAGCGGDWLRPLDRLEGAAPGWDLPAGASCEGAGQQLRVALPRRPAAHGRSRYARFERPGHAVTGDRSQRSRNWMRAETRVGYDYAHAIVDDHSRFAFVELHADERAATVTAFVQRALAFFEHHSITARRLMTDG